MATRSYAVEHTVAAARKFRQENNKNPVSYLVLRALRWGEVRAGGAVLDERLLLPPTAEVRTRIRKFALDGQ
jgi:type VI secretion system protein ImpA